MIRSPNDAVTPGYFDTIGLPLLRGRDFDENDRVGSPPVIIVNRTLASRLFRSQEAVGRRVLVDGIDSEVIGVVPDAFQNSLAQPPMPYFYRPYWQFERVDSRLCIRVDGAPEEYADLIRAEIAAVDPSVPVSEVEPLSERLAATFQPLEFASTVTSYSGIVAVVLTGVGLYGLLALFVGARLREIAIRMALGARREHVVHLVVKSGLRWSVTGILLGVPLALALLRLMSGFLYRVEMENPWIYAGSAVLMLVVALVASYSPARRAASVEPTSALRHE